MEPPPQDEELIEQAANSADRVIMQLQRDGVGLSDAGQKAVDAVMAAARRVRSELESSEQRRTS